MPRYSMNGQQQTTKKGGRRPKEEEYDEYLPPEESEKRQKRRERNKEAAARCRQKRLQQIDYLSQKVKKLQEDHEQKLAEIEKLKKEKSELEFVLNLHEGVCTLRLPNKIERGQRAGLEQNQRPVTLNFISADEAVLDVHTGLTPGSWGPLTPINPFGDSMYQFSDHHNLTSMELGND